MIGLEEYYLKKFDGFYESFYFVLIWFSFLKLFFGRFIVCVNF